MSKTARKVTIHLPADLLEKAQDYTGKGVAEAVRQELQLVVTSSTYEALFKLRGKVHFSKSVRKLREDRS